MVDVKEELPPSDEGSDGRSPSCQSLSQDRRLRRMSRSRDRQSRSASRSEEEEEYSENERLALAEQPEADYDSPVDREFD